tara:strand:- start:13800 stop:13982 length:183 start_codon:yes stop_codon:yes gene_type:complete
MAEGFEHIVVMVSIAHNVTIAVSDARPQGRTYGPGDNQGIILNIFKKQTKRDSISSTNIT